MKFKKGQRIFNHGDMANIEHFGIIIKAIENKEYGNKYIIQVDNEPDHKYQVDEYLIEEVYKGNGTTRIVTIEAFKKYWDEKRKIILEEKQHEYAELQRQHIELTEKMLKLKREIGDIIRSNIARDR